MRISKRIGWAGVAALGLLGGCQGFNGKHGDDASSTLLDSGPEPWLSKKQAADVEVSLGRSAEDQGRFDQARSAYLEALKRDPKRADAELRLAILDDRKGDEAGADRHFSRALKLRPKDPEILCDQGYSLYLRRRWSDAETSLKHALAIDPSHPRSHANLALVLARQGDSPGALAEFARAGCDPSDARSKPRPDPGVGGPLRGVEAGIFPRLGGQARLDPTPKKASGPRRSPSTAKPTREPSPPMARSRRRIDPALLRTSAP